LQENCPEKLTVLNPIATKRKDYPYWEGGKFDGDLPFVDNLVRFCQEGLKLEKSSKTNGMVIPSGVISHRYLQRVIIHPTSSRPGKNWPAEKFIAVSQALENQGYEPVFILTSEEKKQWDKISAPEFPSLDALATFIAESGGMIGNDSGIGHLASCLQLPTVTVCRSRQASRFWRPAWGKSTVVTPSLWIPNMKGLRVRDRYWKEAISVRRVLKSFLQQQSA
jgi:hypothetical protein